MLRVFLNVFVLCVPWFYYEYIDVFFFFASFYYDRM